MRVISDSADTVRAGPKTIFGMPYDFADPSLRGNMEEMIMKMQRGEVG